MGIVAFVRFRRYSVISHLVYGSICRATSDLPIVCFGLPGHTVYQYSVCKNGLFGEFTPG